MGDERSKFFVHKGMGLINNVFNDEAMKKLKGKKSVNDSAQGWG
jgi:glutamine phosphoribosylpyrophosphate amidotransferase